MKLLGSHNFPSILNAQAQSGKKYPVKWTLNSTKPGPILSAEVLQLVFNSVYPTGGYYPLQPPKHVTC